MQSHTAASHYRSASLGAHSHREQCSMLAQENREEKRGLGKKTKLMAASQTGVRGETCLAACREFKGAFTLGEKQRQIGAQMPS